MHTPFHKEIFERFKRPWKSFAFNSYFGFILIGFGGLGIFSKLYQIIMNNETNGYTLAQDMAMYSITIIAASLVDLNLSLEIKSKPSLTINSLAVSGISCVLMFLSYQIQGYWALIPATLAILIALLVWILANADNPNLSDHTYYEKMRGRDVGHGENW